MELQVGARPRSRNTVPRISVETQEKEKESRPAPAALQEILDRPSVGRARPARPVQEEDQEPSLPARLSPVKIKTPPPTTTQRPARLEVVTNRPNFRNSFRQTLQTTAPTTTETAFRSRPFPSR